MDKFNNWSGSDLSPIARKKLVGELRIVFPARTATLELLERCLEDSKHSADPKCVFVGGRSGVGKSSLIESFVADHPRVRGEEVDHVPVLVASIPAASTRKAAASSLLVALGDMNAFSGDLAKLSHRLQWYLKRCGVEMVILDEFQHLIDSDSSKVISKTADWIKTLLIEVRIPFALVGMPEAVQIFDANPQLSRRFTRRTLIEPLTWARGDAPSDLRMLLTMVDKGLPFAVLAGLDHPETVAWFYRHTKGILGLVMAIVREAAEFAIDRGSNRLEKEDLVAAQAQMTVSKPDRKQRTQGAALRKTRSPNISEVLRR